VVNYERVVGVAQLVERRSVAPDVAGSIPVSHPNHPRFYLQILTQNGGLKAIGCHRQLDILMAALAMLIAFANGIFILGMTFKISLLGSGSVLLAGLILGRSAAKAIGEIY
jgi:hypothetical protein